jgi:acetyl esterase/lipase
MIPEPPRNALKQQDRKFWFVSHRIPDHTIFADSAIDKATLAHNQSLIEAALKAPDRWQRTPDELREDRRKGIGPFTLQKHSERAETVTAEALGRQVPVRIIRPAAGPVRGTYLHIHGGGWMLGAADMQDETLGRTADRTGLVCMSVEYRLAPEHPYPAAPDDCETAALWLAENAGTLCGGGKLFIGGESAGGHLSVVTLLRLRDRHGTTPFSGANLVCGIYDLAMTPSMRAFTTPLVLARRDTEAFIARFLQNGEDIADPDISPIHADLAGLPPALFSCGTSDGLLDDSLFMSARWSAAGNAAELSLWPGGPHAFQSMSTALAEASNREIDEFLARLSG